MPGEGQGQHPDLDDVTLLRRVAAKDERALQALFDRHGAALLRFATALANDRATAEDALQEAYVSLWQHADSWRGESSPRAWLYTVARNAVFRQRRRKADDRASHVSLDELGADAGWGDPTAQRSVLERIEREEPVRRALARLDDDERALLWLVDVDGLTVEEAAASFSVTLAAAKSRLHRARLRFVAALRKEDIE
jgi:RNA polymerase sigma-70 factor (ECF subfamily)